MKRSPPTQRQERLVRLRLTGGDAEPGQIPARDVVELLQGAERVLARAAGHVRGRQVRRTGRWEGGIESAVRLRFVAVESGSFVAVLRMPPASPTPLGLNAATLTEGAVREAVAQIAGTAVREYKDVATAVVKWSDALGIGGRYQSVEIDHRMPQVPPARVDRVTTERLRTIARMQPVLRENELIGRLVEADFERHTAHLRTATGDRVEVAFEALWDEEVHQALRQEASVVGEVIYDAVTQRAIAVHLRRLTRGEQLTAGLVPGEAATLPIEEIARQTGLKAVSDPAMLYLDEIDDAELDAFFAAVGHAS
jgi:hypothetical protein